MAERYRTAWLRLTALWSVVILGSWLSPMQTAAAQGHYMVVPGPQSGEPPARLSTGSSQPTARETHRVTLIASDSTLGYVVQELTRQAHLQVVYDSHNPIFAKRVDVHIEKADVMDALASVLKGTQLSAKLAADGETVLINPPSAGRQSSSQDTTAGTVLGRVVDSASENGISGAMVQVDGTKLSAMTDESGKFVVRGVPLGKQFLTVKVFGYKAASSVVMVTASTRAMAHVVLVPVTTVLSGVVTTATGMQQKMAVGSDITTINVDSVMKTAPIQTVTDLLENRVPGLTVVHTDGTPGDPSRLLLRGAASINGSNSPIVVVDGVRLYESDNLGTAHEKIDMSQGTYESTFDLYARPSPLDQIDPNTIATIEVLKGPSASALYGSDAANGVIIITTKKGTPGTTHWNVNATQGVSYIPESFPTLTYVFGHIIGPSTNYQCVDGLIGSSNLHPCIVDSVRAFQALNDPRFSPLTTGPLSNLSASVSGGVSALTYSFTGSAQNTRGTTRMPSFAVQQYAEAVGSSPPTWMRNPDDYGSWSGSGQVQASLSSQASLTVSDMLSSSTQHRTNLGLNAIGALIGVYVDTTNIANTPAFTGFFTQVTQSTLMSTANATLNWRARPWLPLAVTGGYNRVQETDKQYMPAGLPTAILAFADDTTGLYDLGTSQLSMVTLNANTTIPLTLGRGPTFQLGAGTSFVLNSTATQDISSFEVPVGVSDPTTFSADETTVSQLTSNAATYGWFVEPQLAAHSRLFISPGIRLDGGTASGSGAGFTVFPKTNLSYIAIDHTSDVNASGWAQILSLLRLRGTLGIAGVQPQPGQSLRLYSTPTAVSLDGGSVSTAGTVVTALGNTLLRPERSREAEMGFDAQFFQNRASLTATYYNKLRINAIEPVAVAPSIYGFDGPSDESAQTIYQNVGNIRNTGVEFTGQVRVLDRSSAVWTVNGSVSSNTNRVLSSQFYSSESGFTCETASSEINMIYGNCVVVGYPLDAKFRQVAVGYGDLNHDGKVEPNEIFYSDSAVYVGAPDPHYTASFGTTLALWHGRLSLDLQGDYQNGLTVENTLLAALNKSTLAQGGISDNTQSETMTLIQAFSGLQDEFVTVNALRFDALSLNLTLPAGVAHLFRAQQATLALQGRNLGLWTNFSGGDPAASASLAGLDAVVSGGLPLPRTWQITMRINQ